MEFDHKAMGDATDSCKMNLSCFRGQPLKEAAGVTVAKSRTATPVTGMGWREGGVQPDPQKRPEVDVW